VQVTVRYRANLFAITNTESESINAEKIKNVLLHIKTKYGAGAEKLVKTMLIVVNGHSIHLNKHFNTVLKDNDEVSFLPICGGG